MTQDNRNAASRLLRPVGSVFSVFFSYGRRTKKMKAFMLLSLLPVAIAALIRLLQSMSLSRRGFTGMAIFSNIIMVFYLQFLILILALFFGTSVCQEEIEGRTLPYLATRPVSKTAVILGKYASSVVLAAILVNIGVLVSFFILNFDRAGDIRIYKTLFTDMAVLTLGIVCYTAFFTLAGTVLRKAVFFGLVFSFGWENVIQYFPGSTQRFAIVHYLKSLLPPASGGSGFSFLLFHLEPTPQGIAVLVLILLTAVFLGLASLVFSLKEYILED